MASLPPRSSLIALADDRYWDILGFRSRLLIRYVPAVLRTPKRLAQVLSRITQRLGLLRRARETESGDRVGAIEVSVFFGIISASCSSTDSSSRGVPVVVAITLLPVGLVKSFAVRVGRRGSPMPTRAVSGRSLNRRGLLMISVCYLSTRLFRGLFTLQSMA